MVDLESWQVSILVICDQYCHITIKFVTRSIKSVTEIKFVT